MKLTNLKITNYKSILDSSEFSIDQLTCLVGKNEAGKSAILQALYKLNPVDINDKYNALYEYPKMYLSDYESGERKDNRIITSNWEFTDVEKAGIEERFGKGIIVEPSNLTITCEYNNKRQWSMNIDFSILFKNKMIECGFENADDVHFQELSTIAIVRSEIGQISTPSDHEKAFINWFNETFKDDSITFLAEKEFLKYLPKFMYFSEYQKMPGRIAINDYKNKLAAKTLSKNEKVFEALLVLANTSIDDLQNANKLEDLINKTRGVSSKITREIFSYWSQNKHLKVDFRCDVARPGDEAPYNSGYIFSTRIDNTRHDSTVGFDERSAGFVWFFSFLVWFYKLQKEESNLIVLLDEPGLTLHAKAQGDLIRFFKEKITPQFQLIYTTHSPFMLDFNDILSARTVEDATGNNDIVLGTKVGSKVLSKDKDTVFPLQAAFGYDITQTLFIGQNILLVEGPSDILYLHYFSNVLENKGKTSLNKKWTICPSGGIDKIQSFVSLFAGNALKIASLTDYHDGDRNKVERLKVIGILESGRIFIATDYTGFPTSDIEDMIGDPAYVKLVNICYNLTGANKINLNESTNGKILRHVEEKINSLKDVNFNHYTPSVYLVEHPSIFDYDDIKDSLERFEKLFIDLNKLL